MRARIFYLKKSTWLNLSLVVNLILFLTTSILFFIFSDNKNLWFFCFCFFMGLHLINKSLLFKFDSSCYFGVILFLIGLFYFFTMKIGILNFYPVFVVLSFSFSSFCIYSFFNQSFQLFLSLSLLFVAIGLFLFLINLFSVWIFVAIITASVILLVVKYFTLNRSK